MMQMLSILACSTHEGIQHRKEGLAMVMKELSDDQHCPSGPVSSEAPGDRDSSAVFEELFTFRLAQNLCKGVSGLKK